MEEVYLLEEVIMLPDGQRRFRRTRRNLFDSLSEKEFVALTRFTKDGVLRLTERLGAHLTTDSNRGQPVNPADQVHGQNLIFELQKQTTFNIHFMKDTSLIYSPPPLTTTIICDSFRLPFLLEYWLVTIITEWGH